MRSWIHSPCLMMYKDKKSDVSYLFLCFFLFCFGLSVKNLRGLDLGDLIPGYGQDCYSIPLL